MGRSVPLVPAGSAQGRVACPEDAGALTAVRSRGVEINVCPTCSGVWLDRGELERILSSKRIRGVAKGAFDFGSSAPDVAMGVADLGVAAVELIVDVVVGVLSGW